MEASYYIIIYIILYTSYIIYHIYMKTNILSYQVSQVAPNVINLWEVIAPERLSCQIFEWFLMRVKGILQSSFPYGIIFRFRSKGLIIGVLFSRWSAHIFIICKWNNCGCSLVTSICREIVFFYLTMIPLSKSINNATHHFIKVVVLSLSERAFYKLKTILLLIILNNNII